jgi:cephalosporin hydroxylase
VPEDIVVMQEIIWETRPQVVIETGFARGGSAILYSSILALIGDGIVVSVDIDVREHNRRAVEEHLLGGRVNIVEGSSTAQDTMDRVRALVPDGARVMVVLDSNHTHRHVLDELRLYGPLVTEGQFLVVSDTVVEDIPPQTHRPREWGPGNNPKTALQEYLIETDRFEPDPWFNSKLLITSSRGGYLRCVEPAVSA